jgi:hypothetical protein
MNAATNPLPGSRPTEAMAVSISSSLRTEAVIDSIFSDRAAISKMAGNMTLDAAPCQD